ncbi:MAG: hypothetical protein HY291_03005 [Planctomycetes bacterium]|nr:hypothetical protein [Planctomycetota bacterium]
MESRPWNWLRVHLSTAVLMMLAAAAILGIQFKPNPDSQYISAHCNCDLGDYYGWPFAFFEVHHEVVVHERANGKVDYTRGEANAFDWIWTPGFLLNLGLALWALWFIKYLSEYVIRRREARDIAN